MVWGYDQDIYRDAGRGVFTLPLHRRTPQEPDEVLCVLNFGFTVEVAIQSSFDCTV